MRDKSTAQVFIISMAVIDLFTCMVIIPLTMFVEYINHEIKYDFLCKLYHFLITSKIPMSAFIMVAIAFDRYFCICHALKRIITIGRARVIVVCLALLAGLFGVITSLFYGVYQIVHRVDGRDIDKALGTNFSMSIAYVDELEAYSDRSHLYSNTGQIIMSTLALKHPGINKTVIDNLPVTIEIVYIGTCNPSKVIFEPILFYVYQRTYMAVYPMCLVTVMILYFMIYRFICVRRSRKLQQKLIMCSYINGDGTYENTKLVSGDVDDARRNSKVKTLTTTDSPSPKRSPSRVNASPPSAPSLRNSLEETNMTDITSLHEGKRPGADSSADVTHKSKVPACPTNVATPTEHDDDDTPILSFYNCNSSNSSFKVGTSDRSQLVSARRHSHHEHKYQWHKNRDSMKRNKCKNKRRRSQYSCDADRLREENRSANVRTALMLFTVTLVFMVAFVPAWIMAHRLITYSVPVFYFYFVYNVANPFIYAFMNHTFKNYMRKMFTCRRLRISRRAS